MLKLVG